jgi:hypothetical protein
VLPANDFDIHDIKYGRIDNDEGLLSAMNISSPALFIDYSIIFMEVDA